MWHIHEIVVQQESFYDQVDKQGNKLINREENKIDRTRYFWSGWLGEVFYSFQFKKPDINDKRYIFDKEFRSYSYTVQNNFLFFKRYKVSWSCNKLDDYETIAEFYYENLWKQVPDGTKNTKIKEDISLFKTNCDN